MIEAKRKAGRPKAPPTEVIRIRLPLPVHAKVMEKGGDKWVKRLINEAIAGLSRLGGYQPIDRGEHSELKPPPKKP